MDTNKKPVLGVVGVVFFVTGICFIVSGHPAVGMANVAVGIVFGVVARGSGGGSSLSSPRPPSA